MWKNLVVGAVGSILAVGVLASTEKFLGWMTAIFDLRPTVPAGAIVAFDKDCPKDGWELYGHGAGRFLLGADEDNEFRAQKTGGQQSYKLTVDQMPKHKHDNNGEFLLVKVTGKNTIKVSDNISNAREFDLKKGYKMEDVGKGKDIDNMPPYIAVNFCEKVKE